MKEFKYTITDPEGIHARPAGELVKAAKEFASTIKLNKDGKAGDCKRIFGIMGLAVKQGNEVTFTFEGEDEDEKAMVGKVALVNEAKKYLFNENGHEATAKELSDYTQLSEDELADLLLLIEKANEKNK